MARFAAESGVSPELRRVPFFLEPDYTRKPDGWSESHYERMTRKFGSVEAFERVKAAHRLMPRATEAGLDADGWSNENLDRRRQSSTLRAHRLVMWIDARCGWERAEAAYAHLNHAHFVGGALLNDMELLRAAAAAAGVDADEAEAFLRTPRGEAEVWRTIATLDRLGVHSIPTLIVQGQVMAQGAEREDEYLEVLREAARHASRHGSAGDDLFDHSAFATF